MKAIGELMDAQPPPTFNDWFDVYPKGRRTKNEKVVAKWDSLTPEKQSACYLGTLKHVEHNPQWRDPQYVPMMATFLNQERWDYEVVITRKEEATDRAQQGDNAEKVWAAMIEMYGEQFVKLHGAKPSALWSKFIKDLPAERIKRGLRVTMQRNTEFPPSLPSFLTYCAPTFDEQHPNKALPRPEGDPNLAADSFEKMFKILGVKHG